MDPTLTQLIADAIRTELTRPPQAQEDRMPYVVEPVDGGGLRAGVDLDDSAGLLDIMEQRPTAAAVALHQIEQLRDRHNFAHIEPGERHWRIFADLCTGSGAKGNLIADAYLAAIAIESGSRWATTDRAFARFPGLEWFHPLDG